MITINIARVHELVEEQKLKPAPKINISIVENTKVKLIAADKKWVDRKEIDYESIAQSETRSELRGELWKEYDEVMLERNKLSSQIYDMVEDGATQEQLKQHYDNIESYRPALQELFDRARHVDRYGKLPEPKAQENPSLDLLTLKDQKKKLIDRRCKLQAKIKKGEAKNPDRVIAWQLELEQANAEYNHVDDQLKKLGSK